MKLCQNHNKNIHVENFVLLGKLIEKDQLRSKITSVNIVIKIVRSNKVFGLKFKSVHQ